MVVAEVPPARAERGQVVSDALETPVRLVRPRAVEGSGGRGHSGPGAGGGRVQGTPDEELPLDEALVDAEVATGGGGDLRAVVEGAVTAVER